MRLILSPLFVWDDSRMVIGRASGDILRDVAGRSGFRIIGWARTRPNYLAPTLQKSRLRRALAASNWLP
jgi:hypothetical protein